MQRTIRSLKPLGIFITMIPVFYSLSAQQPGRGRPPMRKHTITQKKEWQPVPATKTPRFESKSAFQKRLKEIKVEANGIPWHKVGQFPNRGNPHTISEQTYNFEVRTDQKPNRKITPLHNDSGFGPPNTPFGIAVNGVLFDPGTAEFFNGDRSSDWNYEALSGAVPLGVDFNNAHVQPNGAYHYHGLPTGLLDKLKVNEKEHSPLIGYGMDGYPIYALYGYKDPKNSKSSIKNLKSSYKLKKGMRPRSARNPAGKYDGTFSKDYEYVEGFGDLDECNGRFTVTAEYPEGTYAYFLTEDWPVIPRNFKATPLKLRGGPPHSNGHRHRPPHRPRRFQ
jgi:hypothetical protein